MDLQPNIHIQHTLQNTQQYLDPRIWGPHYWFVLHTIALTYPSKPNEVIKKKYYDFIQNLPIFLPNERISNKFIEYLDQFPVTPYLDSRSSFMKWVHFIHNKVNASLGKEEFTFIEGLEKYYSFYKNIDLEKERELKKKTILLYGSIIGGLLITSYFLYNHSSS